MTENETVNMRDDVGIVPYEYLMTENETGNMRDDVGIVPYDFEMNDGCRGRCPHRPVFLSKFVRRTVKIFAQYFVRQGDVISPFSKNARNAIIII